jgi:hypothetical protein
VESCETGIGQLFRHINILPELSLFLADPILHKVDSTILPLHLFMPFLYWTLRIVPAIQFSKVILSGGL